MPQLDNYPSFSFLKQRASQAPFIDLERIRHLDLLKKYTLKVGSLKFLFPLQKIDKSIFQALVRLSSEAKLLSKLQEVFDGERVNVIQGYASENRAAIHGIFRQLAAPSFKQQPFKKEEEKELQKLTKHLPQLHHRFDGAVIVGIGGSELGVKAVYHAMRAYIKKPLHFISNLDCDELFSTLQSLDCSRTLFIVISKSGKTLETQTNEQVIRSYLQKQGLDPQTLMMAITQKNSEMDRGDFFSRYYLSEHIGGRFSLSSMVGAMALSFSLGLPVYRDFLKGAQDVDEEAAGTQEAFNAPLIAALLSVWNRNFLQASTSCIVPYTSLLKYLPCHLQQLMMESNGKGTCKKGSPLRHLSASVIWGGVGSNVQHSFFQLLHQSQHFIPLELIAFTEPQQSIDPVYQSFHSHDKLISNVLAQCLALAQGFENTTHPHRHFPGNRPTTLLVGKKLDPYTMGCLISFYENKTLFEGFLLGINSFDQEGVELGKTLSKEFLQFFENPQQPFAWKAFVENFYEL